MDRCCVNCGKEIRECMGFVLARDFIRVGVDIKQLREVCEQCSWKLTKEWDE